MPIYVVSDSEAPSPRLVIAKNPASAIRYVTRTITAKIPSAHDLASYVNSGYKVEDAGEQETQA